MLFTRKINNIPHLVWTRGIKISLNSASLAEYIWANCLE